MRLQVFMKGDLKHHLESVSDNTGAVCQMKERKEYGDSLSCSFSLL